MQFKTATKQPTFWVLLAAIGGWLLVAWVTGALGEPEAAQTVATRLPVQVQVVETASGYSVTRKFVGRVEASRESDVGFELAGLVAVIDVVEGEKVMQGQVLAALDTELLQARRNELVSVRARAQADLDLSRKTRQRVNELNARDFASGQARDEAWEGYNAAAATLANAQSAIASIDVQIRKSQLIAPFDAVVAKRFVDEGTVISPGTAVLRLLEDASPEARIEVAGDSLGKLVPGQSYDMVIEEEIVRGRLRSLRPERGDFTRGIDALFILQLPFDAVRRGDLAQLTLEETVEVAGFALPLSALTESSRGLWAVYVAEPDARGGAVLARRQVELLHHDGDTVFVRGTLASGEAVVTEGLHRLVPGQAVSLNPLAVGALDRSGS